MCKNFTKFIDIKFAEEKVEEIVMKNLGQVIKSAKKNLEVFPTEMKKVAPKAWKVPKCGKLTLTSGKSQKNDVIQASVLASVSKQMRKVTTNEVHEELKPELKQQFSELNPKPPQKLEKYTLAATKKTVVKKLVNVAYDKLILKAQDILANEEDSCDKSNGGKDIIKKSEAGPRSAAAIAS
eukprot:470500_1